MPGDPGFHGVAFGREPRADLALAYETTNLVYAGYRSAEEGRRIAP